MKHLLNPSEEKTCETSSEPMFFDKLALNYNEVAHELGLSECFIRRLKSRGQIPYFNVGKAVRFNRETLKKWIEEREIL